MKKSLKLFLFAAISFSAIANAALPPLYESLSEYKSLLNSQELAEKLGSAEGIKDIKRTEHGFQISTYRYVLNVDTVFEPQGFPGPAKFHFVFHELEPKGSDAQP
jgi:hypothetical protein